MSHRFFSAHYSRTCMAWIQDSSIRRLYSLISICTQYNFVYFFSEKYEHSTKPLLRFQYCFILQTSLAVLKFYLSFNHTHLCALCFLGNMIMICEVYILHLKTTHSFIIPLNSISLNQILNSSFIYCNWPHNWMYQIFS